MAGFAIHPGMLAGLFQIQNIDVTAFAGLVSGKSYGVVRYVSDGIAAVVPVLTEAFWNDETPDDQKCHGPHGKDGRQSK
jgi:hypothetical protein